MADDAQALLEKADKKASSSASGFLSSVFGSGGNSSKYEEAADLYIEAANRYRFGKDSESAGKAFEKAAKVQIKSDILKDDAANTLVEAFKCYRTNQPNDAVRVLEQAIDYFTRRGQFRRGANYKQDLGQIYEVQLMDMPKAIDAYQDAGDWFLNDHAEALSNKCFLKVADLSAIQGDYSRAISKYNQVASQSLNNNLTRWSLKDYFFKSILCHIAQGDLIASNNELNHYIELDPSFNSTREYKLLIDIISSIQDGDVDQFTQLTYQFDQFSRLDKWKTTLLLRIKNNITQQEEDLR